MLEPNRPAALYTTEADAEETEENASSKSFNHRRAIKRATPLLALSRSNGPGIGNRGRSVDLPLLSLESHHGVTCCHAPPLSSSRLFFLSFLFQSSLPGLDHPERARAQVGRHPARPIFHPHPSLLPSRFDAGHLLTLTERKLLKWGQNALLDTSKAPVDKSALSHSRTACLAGGRVNHG